MEHCSLPNRTYSLNILFGRKILLNSHVTGEELCSPSHGKGFQQWVQGLLFRFAVVRCWAPGFLGKAR